MIGMLTALCSGLSLIPCSDASMNIGFLASSIRKGGLYVISRARLLDQSVPDGQGH